MNVIPKPFEGKECTHEDYETAMSFTGGTIDGVWEIDYHCDTCGGSNAFILPAESFVKVKFDWYEAKPICVECELTQENCCCQVCEDCGAGEEHHYDMKCEICLEEE